MKKLILLGLLICPFSLGAMENRLNEKPKFTPEEYEQNSWVHERIAAEALKVSDVDLKGKEVMDVGCFSGSFTAKMAGDAIFIAGFDTCPEMIRKAQQKYDYLSATGFECILPEALAESSEWDVVTSFFCLSRIEDKKPVFANFYEALRPGGEMVCALPTYEEQSPLMGMIIANYQKALNTYSFLEHYQLPYLVDRYGIATADLKSMLTECGFEKITIQPISFSIEFESKDAYLKCQKMWFMATPFAALIRQNASQDDLDQVFEEFTNILWDSFKKNDERGAFYPVTITVVTAQKPA